MLRRLIVRVAIGDVWRGVGENPEAPGSVQKVLQFRFLVETGAISGLVRCNHEARQNRSTCRPGALTGRDRGRAMERRVPPSPCGLRRTSGGPGLQESSQPERDTRCLEFAKLSVHNQAPSFKTALGLSLCKGVKHQMWHVLRTGQGLWAFSTKSTDHFRSEIRTCIDKTDKSLQMISNSKN